MKKLILALIISTPALAMEYAYPVIEIPIKITSFDSHFVKAETKDHRNIKLTRKSVTGSLMTGQFKTYDISLEEWINANDQAKTKN